MTNALEGGKLPLYGDGLNVRDWLHVDDHADGIEAALLHGEPGEVYNIGGGNERTNREITTIILDELGLDWDATVERVTDRPGHDRRYSIACAKAARGPGLGAGGRLRGGPARHHPLVPRQRVSGGARSSTTRGVRRLAQALVRRPCLSGVSVLLRR